MNKEQYEYAKQYYGAIDLFYRTGEYVGGCNGLFDYWEAQGMTGGYKIDRSCVGCISGFLKDFYQMINRYEKDNTI
jgi:hypothetical protein